MDTHEDLPLFSWSPPCKVLAFPLARRTAKVRRVADVLRGKQGRARRLYWSQTIDALEAQMFRAGIDGNEVMTELHSFRDAVEAELARMLSRSTGGLV